jgi:AmiR/NasT family two-component response regulator
MERSGARREIEQLKIAVEHRTAIGVALGILMERHKISQANAWSRLVDQSQATQRKVYDLAVELGRDDEQQTV